MAFRKYPPLKEYPHRRAIAQACQAALQTFRNGQWSVLDDLKALQSMEKWNKNGHDNARLLLNQAVVEFYQGKCLDMDGFLEKMLSIRVRVLKKSKEEFVEVAPTIYNICVLYFRKGDREKAASLLLNLFPYLDGVDDALASRICYLLLDCLLVVRDTKQAIPVVEFLESIVSRAQQHYMLGNQSTHGKGRKVKKEYDVDTLAPTLSAQQLEMMQARLCGYKARLYATNEVTSPELRGHIAWQEERYEEALACLEQVEPRQRKHPSYHHCPNDPYYTLQGMGMVKEQLAPFLNTKGVVANARGCIYQSMGKTDLARLEWVEALRAVKEPVVDWMGASVMYNTGVHLLHEGHPRIALDCLQRVQQWYKDQPRFWIRLGEACIQVHVQKEQQRVQRQHSPVVVKVSQQGRLVLPHHRAICSEEPVDGWSPLGFAESCFRTALGLMKAPKEAPLLLRTALLGQAYVALCRCDYEVVLSSARRWKEGEPWEMTMYAAEALLLTGQPKDALHHIGRAPKSDVGVLNMGVCYARQGLMEQAAKCAYSLLERRVFYPRAVLLLAYVYMWQGRTQQALELIQCCGGVGELLPGME